ncbi:MAG: nicotinate phosphoribosyltransferase [Clostridia bacterium]|nr:nicotinate phosphoribosyltransferase [Clostridia bacterium]
MERKDMALLTDFYELTMMYGFWKKGRENRRVCFEYFFRELPPHNGFALFAGLDQVLAFINNFSFTDEDLRYLRQVGLPDEFLAYLRSFRLEIDLWAVPEGTVVFPYEPLVRVEGPLASAQLLEAFLLNALNYPTLVATKAARICYAAEGDPVLEFGLRRAQGPDGGVTGSRAAYIGGCVGTSNALAGQIYGIPVKGTHAHSWVMSFDSELEAFRAYIEIFPENPVLLVDTYDPLTSGIPNAVKVFKEFREKGLPLRGAIRLDSGDLAKLSKEAWRLFREAGFEDPLIVASNELEEDLIADLKRQQAKVNSWGVGTHLITARDHPALGGVYKIVAVQNGQAWEPKIKISGNISKITDPGRKQVVRYYLPSGAPLADVLYLENEAIQTGEVRAYDRENLFKEERFAAGSGKPLLQKLVEKGKVLPPPESLEAVRERALANLAALPGEYRRLRYPQTYSVLLSPGAANVKRELLTEAGFFGRR